MRFLKNEFMKIITKKRFKLRSQMSNPKNWISIFSKCMTKQTKSVWVHNL